MGDELSFRLNLGAATSHSMFDEDDELAEYFGNVHFSGVTAMCQKRVYGIDWTECITFGPEGEAEMIGSPDSPGFEGWYTPDWDRAVSRVQKLVAAWEATDHEHRKGYDAQCLPKLRDLIHKCSNHPQRQFCQIRLS